MSLLMKFCPSDAIVLLAANALVQIVVVVALAWLLAVGFARHRAAVRHGIWLCALLCVLASPLAAYVADWAGLSLISLRLLPPVASANFDVSPPLVAANASIAASASIVASPPPSPHQLSSPEQPSVAVRRGADDLGTDGQKSSIGVFQASGHDPHALPKGEGTVARAFKSQLGDPLWAVLGMVVVLWAGGALFFVARLVRGWRQIAGLQRRLQPVIGDRVQAVLPEVRRVLKIETLPRLAILPRGTEVAGPITIGLLRPLVILPESVLDTLDASGLRDVLVHEFAHALRHDPLVGLLQRLAGIVYWPLPPVHLLNRRLAWAREEVCDNYVLRQGDAPSYGETLLAISETIRSFRIQPAALGLCHPRGRLEQRVAGLLDPRRNVMVRTHRVALVALTMLFAAAMVGVAGTRLLRAEPPAAPEVTAKPAAVAAGPVERRAVNKRVKDFPENVDLSTPESALAARYQAGARMDGRAYSDTMWLGEDTAKDLVKEFEQAVKHDEQASKHDAWIPENLSQVVLETEFIEVLTYRDDLAIVIFKQKGRKNPNRTCYGCEYVRRINGIWKVLDEHYGIWKVLDEHFGQGDLLSAEAAREKADDDKDRVWQVFTHVRGEVIRRENMRKKVTQFMQVGDEATHGRGTPASAPAAPEVAAKPAAVAAGPVERRAVNKRVKDFPEKVDLSTPESVVVAMARAMVSKDVGALGDMYWNGFDMNADAQQLLSDPLFRIVLGSFLQGTEILDVFTCRDDIAAVITRLDDPPDEPVYALSLFAKINGVWKGFALSDVTLEKVGRLLADRPDADPAKEFFDKRKDDFLAVITAAQERVALKGGPATESTTAQQAVPQGPLQDLSHIGPLDVLSIRGLGTLIDQPIDGFYLVEPDGQVALGPSYGRADVGGLMIEQAEQKVAQQLRKILNNPEVQVVLALKQVTPWKKAEFLRVPYTIRPMDVLQVRVTGTLLDQPIDGFFLVEAAGTIPLGPAYGRAQVNGLTLEEAETAIQKKLAEVVTKPDVQVTLPSSGGQAAPPTAQLRWQQVSPPKAPYTISPGDLLSIRVAGTLPKQPIDGDYLVEPAGTVALGPGYGRVAVKGLTLDAAEKAIRKKLDEVAPNAMVQVAPAGWKVDHPMK